MLLRPLLEPYLRFNSSLRVQYTGRSYFFRPKSFANQRERLQGRLFSSRLLICSWLLFPFVDCFFINAPVSHLLLELNNCRV